MQGRRLFLLQGSSTAATFAKLGEEGARWELPGESGGGGATRVLSLGTLTLSRAPVLMNCSLSTG